MRRIDALVDIEREINGRPPDRRREVRQARSRPLVDDLEAWMHEQRVGLSGRSDRGAERAAVMVTLIVTPKLDDIDPQGWLADVLARFADMPQSGLQERLPWTWKAARAECQTA